MSGIRGWKSVFLDMYRWWVYHAGNLGVKDNEKSKWGQERMMRLILVRHGETERNSEARLQGGKSDLP